MSAAKTAEELSAARPVMIEQVAALVAANAEEFSKNGDDRDEDEDPTFPRPSALVRGNPDGGWVTETQRPSHPGKAQ